MTYPLVKIQTRNMNRFITKLNVTPSDANNSKTISKNYLLCVYEVLLFSKPDGGVLAKYAKSAREVNTK
jgi:hypothetical protein